MIVTTSYISVAVASLVAASANISFWHGVQNMEKHMESEKICQNCTKRIADGLDLASGICALSRFCY